jgi:hypothetical protein
MEEIFNFLSPFIAAFLASWITYRLTLKSKKIDYLLKYRIESFKNLSNKISQIKKQYLYNISELTTDDIGIHKSILENNKSKSTMILLTELISIHEESQIFLTKKARSTLNDFIKKTSTICGMELSMSNEANQEDFKESYVNRYNQAIKEIESCLEVLYKELKIP